MINEDGGYLTGSIVIPRSAQTKDQADDKNDQSDDEKDGPDEAGRTHVLNHDHYIAVGGPIGQDAEDEPRSKQGKPQKRQDQNGHGSDVTHRNNSTFFVIGILHCCPLSLEKSLIGSLLFPLGYLPYKIVCIC